MITLQLVTEVVLHFCVKFLDDYMVNLAHPFYQCIMKESHCAVADMFGFGCDAIG